MSPDLALSQRQPVSLVENPKPPGAAQATFCSCKAPPEQKGGATQGRSRDMM